MGGMGSGRLASRQRQRIEDSDSIDLNSVNQFGLTIFPVYAYIGSENGYPVLFIDYSIDWMRPSSDELHRFKLEYTKTSFGGNRAWIICNCCGKRVRKLYRPASNGSFKCRTCHDLVYSSQCPNVYDGWRKKHRKEG